MGKTPMEDACVWQQLQARRAPTASWILQEAWRAETQRQAAAFLDVGLAKRSLISFAEESDETQEVQQHDCGYCLARGEKRCCEYQDEGTCETCCKEHFTTDLYCRMNCARMCRRGVSKEWSGGKMDVPVCPVGGPNKAIEAFDLAKMQEQSRNPYLDWKGEKFEKEWLAAHPLPKKDEE
mmetsp:Transcript_53409/g.124346  ORF Transcript_53409/g.124346 Transcript_53409/m.124346 type:complete len:180 (-) Transcript_53409:4-543(-)